MAEIVLTRLDSRLAHGTVCSTWIPGLAATGVIVVHEKHCKDAFIQKIFKKAVPAGVWLETLSIDDAVSKWKENKFGDGKVIVLFGDVETAYSAYKKGYRSKELQIANIPVNPSQGKVMVHQSVGMDRADSEMLKNLQDEYGVNIYFQAFPNEVRRPLNDVLAKAKFKK